MRFAVARLLQKSWAHMQRNAYSWWPMEYSVEHVFVFFRRVASIGETMKSGILPISLISRPNYGKKRAIAIIDYCEVGFLRKKLFIFPVR